MRNHIKALFVAALLCVAVPSQAQIHLDVHIGPPAPRHEIIVAAPYTGAVWVPGYYVYDTRVGNYVWIAGHYERPPRPNVVWVTPRYVPHAGHYDYYEGRWGNPGKHKGWEKQEAHSEGHGHGHGHEHEE